MLEMLAEALRGIPRETYRLMTKLRWQYAANPGYKSICSRKKTNQLIRCQGTGVLSMKIMGEGAFVTHE